MERLALYKSNTPLVVGHQLLFLVPQYVKYHVRLLPHKHGHEVRYILSQRNNRPIPRLNVERLALYKSNTPLVVGHQLLFLVPQYVKYHVRLLPHKHGHEVRYILSQRNNRPITRLNVDLVHLHR